MKKIYLSILFLVLLTAQAFAGISFFPNPNMMRIGGSDGIGFWNAGYARYSFYANYPNLKDRSNKVNPSVVFEARDYADATSAGDAGENTVYITPDNNLNVGPGAYTVLNGMSDDISDAYWDKTTANTPAPDEFQATAQNGRVANSINTTDSLLYTLSFYARVEIGGALTGYQFRHLFSETGSSSALTLTEDRKRYSVTVLGKSGNGAVEFGLRDANTGPTWSKVYIDTINITQSDYALPPIINNTASSVSIPLNYEGVKYQLTPDPIGSVYTGEVGSEVLENTSFDTTLSPWTSAANWAWEAGGRARHTSGATNSLVGAESVVNGDTYRAKIIVGGRTAGSVKLRVGNGSAATSYSSNGTFTENLLCAGNTAILITPTSDFDGYIDFASIKQVSRNMGATQLYDALDGVADGAEALTVSTTDFSTWASQSNVTLTEDAPNSRWKYSISADTARSVSGGVSSTVGVYAGSFLEIEAIVNTSILIKYGATSVNETELIAGQKIIVPSRGGTDAAQTLQFWDTSGSTGDRFYLYSASYKAISPAQGKLELDWVPQYSYDDVPVENCNLLSVRSNAIDLLFNRGGAGHVRINDATTDATAAGVNWQAQTPYTITAQWGPKADDTLSAEKVVNGDCESALPTLNSRTYSLYNVTAALSAEQAHAGSNSMKVTKTNTTQGASTRFQDAYLLGLVNNTSYEVGVWVYLPSSQTVDTLHLAWRDGEGATQIIESTAVTDSWVYLSGTVLEDAWLESTNDRILWVYASNDTVSGEFWYVDDLTLKADNTPKMQLTVTDGTTTWQSTVTDFEGSFDPGDDLSLGYDNSYWQKFSKIRVYPDPKW